MNFYFFIFLLFKIGLKPFGISEKDAFIIIIINSKSQFQGGQFPALKSDSSHVA